MADIKQARKAVIARIVEATARHRRRSGAPMQEVTHIVQSSVRQSNLVIDPLS